MFKSSWLQYLLLHKLIKILNRKPRLILIIKIKSHFYLLFNIQHLLIQKNNFHSNWKWKLNIRNLFWIYSDFFSAIWNFRVFKFSKRKSSGFDFIVVLLKIDEIILFVFKWMLLSSFFFEETEDSFVYFYLFLSFGKLWTFWWWIILWLRFFIFIFFVFLVRFWARFWFALTLRISFAFWFINIFPVIIVLFFL